MQTVLASQINKISFDGLGLGTFELNRVAFSLFGIDIYWYAILITFGMLLAVVFGCLYSKKVGLCPDDVVDVLIYCLVPALIGARLFYVVFSLDYYRNADGSLDFLEILNVRDGGLAIYGGIIVAFAVCLLVCHLKKISARAMFDVGAFGFLIGQCIGRWGNFMNAEAYGYETTLPWGMTINGEGPYHPTFLYESLWNLIGFFVLLILAKFGKKKNGETFLEYFVWYGVGRFVIEGYRSDSLWTDGEGSIRISQLLGIVFAVVGLVLLILLRVGVFDKLLDARERKRVAARALAQEKKAAKAKAKEDAAQEKQAEENAAYNPLFGDKNVTQTEEDATEEPKAETPEAPETEVVCEASVAEEGNNENA